jgi:hypothetical protein
VSQWSVVQALESSQVVGSPVHVPFTQWSPSVHGSSSSHAEAPATGVHASGEVAGSQTPQGFFGLLEPAVWQEPSMKHEDGLKPVAAHPPFPSHARPVTHQGAPTEQSYAVPLQTPP